MTSRQTDIFRGPVTVDGTLVLPIPSLNLFVLSLLDLAFQNPGSLGLIKIRDFEYLGRVKPRIRATAHDCYAVAHPEPQKKQSQKSRSWFPRETKNSKVQMEPRTSHKQEYHCTLPRKLGISPVRV